MITRFAVPALAAVVIATAAWAQADDPVGFGRRVLDQALAARGLKPTVRIDVTGSRDPESYAITFENGAARIEGADPNGALYGALELAERIARRGPDALRGGPVSGRPFLRDRGWNMFLTLPWDFAKANTDYDPRALVDPARWWFANDGFWRTLFDQMAEARMNWLDIHGTWDISVTDAPNLYAYFIKSDRFPKVGVAPVVLRPLRWREAILVLELGREAQHTVALIPCAAPRLAVANRDVELAAGVDHRTGGRPDAGLAGGGNLIDQQ